MINRNLRIENRSVRVNKPNDIASWSRSYETKASILSKDYIYLIFKVFKYSFYYYFEKARILVGKCLPIFLVLVIESFTVKICQTYVP